MQRLGEQASAKTLKSIRGSLIKSTLSQEWMDQFQTTIENENITKSAFHQNVLNGKYRQECVEEMGKHENQDPPLFTTHPYFFLEHMLQQGGGTK